MQTLLIWQVFSSGYRSKQSLIVTEFTKLNFPNRGHTHNLDQKLTLAQRGKKQQQINLLYSFFIQLNTKTYIFTQRLEKPIVMTFGGYIKDFPARSRLDKHLLKNSSECSEASNSLKYHYIRMVSGYISCCGIRRN